MIIYLKKEWVGKTFKINYVKWCQFKINAYNFIVFVENWNNHLKCNGKKRLHMQYSHKKYVIKIQV